MTDTLRITCDQKELDTNSNESNLYDFTITEDFNDSTKPKFTLPSANVWYDVNLGQIDGDTGAVFMSLESDRDLTVKLNNGSQEFENVQNILWKGKITGLAVKNTSDASAVIQVMFFE